MGFPWRHPPVGGQHSTLRRTQEAGPPHSGRPTIGCVHGGDTLPRRGRALARGSGSVGDPRVRCSSADASGQGSGRPGPRTGTPKGVDVVRDALTLRQTCPQPRPRAQFAFKDSMIHGQCRSHYVSHFAAFFIVARAKISVVESCLWFNRRCRSRPRRGWYFRHCVFHSFGVVWLERVNGARVGRMCGIDPSAGSCVKVWSVVY